MIHVTQSKSETSEEEKRNQVAGAGVQGCRGAGDYWGKRMNWYEV